MNKKDKKTFTLKKKDGKTVLQFEGSKDSTPVKVVWARPLSGRGKEISFIDNKKKEVVMVNGLHELDHDSRKIAEETLDLRYLVTKITKVYRTKTHFGTRFWTVQTNRGTRIFAMRDPFRNTTFFDDDRVVIYDTLGNSYEIESIAALDKQSREQVEKVL